MDKGRAISALVFVQEFLEGLPDEELVDLNEKAFDGMQNMIVVLMPHLHPVQLEILFGKDLLGFISTQPEVEAVKAVRNLGFTLPRAHAIARYIKHKTV